MLKIPNLSVYAVPEEDSVIIEGRVTRAEFEVFAARHSAAILNKLVDRCVEDVMQSASVQARLRAIRADLPSRLEEAITKAVTQRILEGL